MNLKLVSVAVPEEVFPHMLLYVVPCAGVLLTLLKNVPSVQVRFVLLPTDCQFYQDLRLLAVVREMPEILQDI